MSTTEGGDKKGELIEIKQLIIKLQTNIPGKENTEFTRDMLYNPSLIKDTVGYLNNYPFITTDYKFKPDIISYNYNDIYSFFFNKKIFDNKLRRNLYGEQKKFPIKENFKLNPINYYAVTKLKCEDLIKRKLKKFKIPHIIYRLFTVYGPMGRPDMFIYSTIKKINKGKEIILYNHGKSLRDFTYIDDVIKVFIQSVSKKINNNPIINICSSNPINILKITNIIGKILRKKIRVRFRNSRKGEMDKTHGSNVFLKKIFKIKNFTKINKGLRNIVYSQQNSL